MNRVTDSMTTMDNRDVKSLFLDSKSSISGVEDEFGGFVSVCLDPFWFRNEVKERVGEQGKT